MKILKKSIAFILVPSMPPTDLKARNTSSTSIQLMWNPLADPTKVHGILLGYLIIYRRENGLGIETSKTTGPSTLLLVIDKLDKFRSYVFKVLAFTKKGNGPFTNWTICSTDEDGK